MDETYRTYALAARDLLFFRDARPMDMDKSLRAMREHIGHGAVWPRPDHLFAALMHHLIKAPDAGGQELYGSMPNLNTLGPFPSMPDGGLLLPIPLDWDMELRPVPKGCTDLPAPLTHGFCDREMGKKAYPQWISLEDYNRYLLGKTQDAPQKADAFSCEHRTGVTLDDATGAALRHEGLKETGRYRAEYLRLRDGVQMICAVRGVPEIGVGTALRMGGQGGTVSTVPDTIDLMKTLRSLPSGEPTRFVRWTLIAPALFTKGWYPNWLDAEGRVMFPQQVPTRKPGETRPEHRKRIAAEADYFPTARLIAARIGTAGPISGWDSRDGAKPTELTVPAGSCYVFACADTKEATTLVEALHLVPRSDWGEKGFGIGLASFVAPSEN